MAFDLYVVTDETIGFGRSHARQAELALRGGADIIQLRDKTLPDHQLLRVAEEIRHLTSDAGALFIVNDSPVIAFACGADGLHLGQQDIPVATAREHAPPGFLIGTSVGSVAEAVSAERAGADYLALSPVFATTSKADAGNGFGLARLKDIRDATRLPLIAIGGITHGNVGSVIAAGADGVAVISAVVGAEDISAAAAEMKARILAAKQQGSSPYF